MQCKELKQQNRGSGLCIRVENLCHDKFHETN